MSVRGMFSSLRLVLAALAGACVGAVLVLGFLHTR